MVREDFQIWMLLGGSDEDFAILAVVKKGKAFQAEQLLGVFGDGHSVFLESFKKIRNCASGQFLVDLRRAGRELPEMLRERDSVFGHANFFCGSGLRAKFPRLYESGGW